MLRSISGEPVFVYQTSVHEDIETAIDEYATKLAKDLNADITGILVDRSHHIDKPNDGKLIEILVKFTTSCARSTWFICLHIYFSSIV